MSAAIERQMASLIAHYTCAVASVGQTTGTVVFLASDPSELIGIIEGTQPKTLSLSQPVFQYV
jgi:hypothetical protein